MHVRLLGCLLLCALATQAQEDKKNPKLPGPFAAPPPGFQGWPGARARYYEEMQSCKARLERDPADADALEHALLLCQESGISRLLVPAARAAVKAHNEDEASHLRNRGVLGQVLFAEANTIQGRGVVFWVNGRQQPAPPVSDKQKNLVNEAIEHLRAAVKKDRTRPRLRYALAEALESLQDSDAENPEADKLRDEAESIAIREERSDPAVSPYTKQAESLIQKALLAEQVNENPDHAGALDLRKKALVLRFCSDTIVFDFTPALYERVSRLAPRGLVFDVLTRTFQDRAEDVQQVAPNYHAASIPKKLRLVEALGKEQTSGADAALLALVRGSESTFDPIAEAAAKTLAGDGHDAARRGMPVLLATALGAIDQERFPREGQRRLTELVASMNVAEAAGVLAVALPNDADLRWPLGIADALGKLGKPEHADALLKIALDTTRALHFRREAARAFARLASDRVGELANHPELELALAAARYEKAPDEATLGALLNAFNSELDVDDAARYCADLKIAEAGPAMDSFLRKYGAKRDHVARLVVERARKQLNAEG